MQTTSDIRADDFGHRQLRGAVHHAHAVTACELFTAYQACSLSGRPAPAGCRAMVGRLAEIIGPIEADRPFGEDIERLLGAGLRSWPQAGHTG